jgi:hypothetical protein
VTIPVELGGTKIELKVRKNQLLVCKCCVTADRMIIQEGNSNDAVVSEECTAIFGQQCHVQHVRNKYPGFVDGKIPNEFNGRASLSLACCALK